MNIGELNIKVTVLNRTSGQDDDTGVITSSLTASWDKWANVEMNNGNRVLDQAAIAYKEAYTVKMRRETSRPTLSNYHLSFDEKELTIHSVTIDRIGKQWYEIITAFTTITGSIS